MNMFLSHTLNLLQQVKELELIAKKNTTGMFAGNYLSTVLGHGLEFHEARKYVQGESIRLIDWNMTARLGDVYVKKFREEREREVFLAVDVSPSMFFGSQKRSKIETALEAAATLGFNAINSNDRLGMVSFADTVTDTFLPRKGRSHLFAILKSLIIQKNKPAKDVKSTNTESAIANIQSLRGRKFMIFIISDFIERDLPEDLSLIQDKHDVVLLHVYDPLEYEESKRVFLPFYSPEGSKHTASGKPGSFGNFAEVESFLKGSSLKYGIDVVSISTKDNISSRLISYFKQKSNRRGF
jgi:uncharacterized protein (DUF58 family)